MELFDRVKSNRIYRLLCKYHLFYDMKFMIDYFDTIEIERNKKVENVTDSNREQQQQSRRRLKRSRFEWRLAFISNFLLFRIFYHTTLWIFDSQISPRTQVLLFNPFAIKHFDWLMQIFIIFNLVLILDLLRLIYLHNHGLTFRVVRDAIVENGNSFFLEPRFSFSNRIVHFVARPNHLISQQLLSIGILISNTLSIILCLAYLYLINLAISQLRTHHHFSPLEQAIFWLSLALNLLTINLIFHIALLVGINGALSITIVYVKLTQAKHFVQRHFARKSFADSSITSADFSGAAFYRFRVVILSMMQFLADGNRIYGKAFFNFTLANVPLNSHLIAMLLTERLTRLNRLMAIGIIFGQLFVLIVMHIFAVVMCRRMHRPVKYFFRFIADPDWCVRRGARGSIEHESKRVIDLWRSHITFRPKVPQDDNNQKIEKIKKIKKSVKFSPPQQQQGRHKPISLRLRLQIARYIEYFHTKKEYTANYGRYGAITFASIQKQIFYNIKLILVSYMLYQTKKIANS